MDKKEQFQESLMALIELAGLQGNQISKVDVTNYFKDILDDESLYKPVYEYLASNRIVITDAEEPVVFPTPAMEDEQEKEYVAMYMEDLKGLTPLSEDEEDRLLQLSITGNLDARDQIVVANLNLVLSAIHEYQYKGVGTADLIQEGNLGLIQGVSTYTTSTPYVRSKFHEHLLSSIRSALQDAIQEQIEEKRIGQHLADRANELDTASTSLAGKLGREATAAELAEYLSISEDEVHQIMKISLDALTVPEGTE